MIVHPTPSPYAFICLEHTGEGVVMRGEASYAYGHEIEDAGGAVAGGVWAKWAWDGRELTASVDQFGIAPLFYGVRDKQIAVSPSLMQLVAQGFGSAIDWSAVGSLLWIGHLTGEETPFAGIRALPARGVLRWRDGRVSVEGGFAWPKLNDVDRPTAMHEFMRLTSEAVAARPWEPSNTVLPLSGGKDSRHLLLELCRQGRKPALTYTIRPRAPQPNDDATIAPLVAAHCGVPHRFIDVTDDPIRDELAKNELTDLCADDHYWYMPGIRYVNTLGMAVFDGLGGDFLTSGVVTVPGLLDAAARHDLDAFVLALRVKHRITEAGVRAAVPPEAREAVSWPVVRERLKRATEPFMDAPNAASCFSFATRMRREIALVPYAMMRGVPAVLSPLVDRRVVDWQLSLAPSHFAGSRYHVDALREAFPDAAHIPFSTGPVSRMGGSWMGVGMAVARLRGVPTGARWASALAWRARQMAMRKDRCPKGVALYLAQLERMAESTEAARVVGRWDVAVAMSGPR